jgi:hypothetical protein
MPGANANLDLPTTNHDSAGVWWDGNLLPTCCRHLKSPSFDLTLNLRTVTHTMAEAGTAAEASEDVAHDDLCPVRDDHDRTFTASNLTRSVNCCSSRL